MFASPRPEIARSSAEYERVPLVSPRGFREYDARWRFGEELNLLGVQALGLALASLIHELGARPDIIVGHDYRAYSAGIKFALATGLVAGGARVRDIGLALTPMAYDAQHALDCPCVAMVTASHNENGWTGVKMGAAPSDTFGPREMERLKVLTLGGEARARPGGSYAVEPGYPERYLDRLLDRPKLARRLKAVVACGNGTAGAFAPQALARLGCEVVPLDCGLDHSFPRHNPNPEDLAMLAAIREAVLAERADIGFGFDGDGDRCGVVDETGAAIFADKVGLLIARDLSAVHPGARFVVDVKSTGLFATDPALAANGASVEYWKTGHSHIKRRARETGALAAFEKSGHFLFRPPLGPGYDDGLAAAFAVCAMLDRRPDMTMSGLHALLPRVWSSPTMSPECPDEAKYAVVDAVTATLIEAQGRGEAFAGAAITDVGTVNGARVSVADGSWALVRASSNKPELAVVVESPVSEARMREMFDAVNGLLSGHPQVGPYNQTL